MCAPWDSNPEPIDYESIALPIELEALILFLQVSLTTRKYYTHFRFFAQLNIW